MMKHQAIALATIIFLGAGCVSSVPPTPDLPETSSPPSATESVLSSTAKKQEKPKQEERTSAIESSTAQAIPSFKDGNYIVGTDIQPGTYRTRKAANGCYYSRLSGFGGSLSEIIANELTNFPAVVTIKSTDKGFKSVGCGTWSQDLSPITEIRTIFQNGIYIINTDIEPGTYRSSGGEGCYYSRLKGFSGTMEDIISNDLTDVPAIVTIDKMDVGFKSSGCGTWTIVK